MIDVAIAFDAALAPHAHVVCRSAARNCSIGVRVHALTRGVSDAVFSEFAALAECEVVRHEMSQEWADPKLARWVSCSSMDRILLPRLLPRHGRVIYLDIDCVVLGDLTELSEVDCGECGIAAKPSTREGYQRMSQYADRCGIDTKGLVGLVGGDCRNFNAGVLVLDLEVLRARGMTECAMRLVSETRCNDQLALVGYARDRFGALPPPWNTWVGVDHDSPVTHPHKLLHYVGATKPWDSKTKPLREAWVAHV